MNETFRRGLEDLAEVLGTVDRGEVEAFRRAILDAKRIFVTGLGRSGLMARGFAMRLMHLGRPVFHVGDVITPAIAADDLLIIGSRTGRSPVLGHYIHIARRAGAKVAVITADREGRAAAKADTVLALDDRPVQARRHATAGERPLPLGSLFEQALLVVLDRVVMDLMDDLGLNEADLARVHTTFE